MPREPLSKEEIEKSRSIYGKNELKDKRKRSFFRCYLSNLNDPIIKVLIVALIINIIVMLPKINYLESAGIALSILISTLVSTICEYSSENAFEKLKDSGQNKLSIVKRHGDVAEIPTSEIVVGDVIILESGTKIPADCILIEGEIKLDESALTGESCEVEKYACQDKDKSKIEAIITSSLRENKAKELVLPTKSMLYSGSTAIGGYGEALVVAVGESTFLGKEAGALRESTRPSPLKNRLSQLARLISRLGYIAAGVIAFAYLFNIFVIDSGFNWGEVLNKLRDVKFLLSHLIKALTLAVSITVVAVPEGLPMMITVVLSSNMKKMTRDNVLVRKMVGIETSGNINLLFTDKTGTITEGKLKVKGIINANGKHLSLNDIRKNVKIKENLTLCAYFCTNSSKQGAKIVGSDSVDRALLEYLPFTKPRVTVIEKIPFDSAKKYSAVSIKNENSTIGIFKGAPEIIICSASHYIDENGETKELSSEKVKELLSHQTELSKRGNRVIAVAIKQGGELTPKKTTFLCFVSLKDKIRKEAPNAIKEVSLAGVGVVMITGDSHQTAESIAKEAGIISSETKRHLVLDAEALHKMSDDELTNLLPSLAVVSRALPSDKSRLVKLAQKCGYIVGMTGDGVNDASSLKSADVGFSMGTGTDVAKEASDIVIKDNNFASIVKSILYGRTIFASIRKFVIFQLIMNLSAVGISLIGPFIGVDSPVTITQMLWVNIIMDTLGALAFACEPPLKEYMRAKPIPREEKILSREMIYQIISVATYILILCVWFLKSDTGAMILSNGTEKYMLSAFFGLFIFVGVLVCFTARTKRLNILKGLYKNKAFLPIMIGVMLVQISFIYFGGEALRTVPLTIKDLVSVILISFTVVIFDTIRKVLVRIFSLSQKRVKSKNKFERKMTNVK